MSKKRHGPEQVINKLREAEVLLAKGTKMPVVCKKIGVLHPARFTSLAGFWRM